jgi:hypothetical protein
MSTIGALATPITSVAAVDIQLNFGPPSVRYEVVPAPRRGYVWAPGYWDWRGHHHVWVSGSWVRERPGYAYQPNRWIERDGRWNLERGRWDHARGRDSDHDGIPDRRDPTPYGVSRSSDRDGDGVPNRFDRQPNNPYRH